MSSSKIAPAKPFVILLYGFPGSGKTTFSKQLAEEFTAAHLQQDRIENELFGGASANPKKGRDALDFLTHEFLRAGVSVIYDTDMGRAADRRAIRDYARKQKAVPVLIWLQIDPETAYARGQARDKRKSENQYSKPLTPDEFQAVMNKMQNPTDIEKYVVISGKHTFQTQKAAVFKKLYDLGVLTPAQLSKKIPKPELVNLVPPNPSINRGDIMRRNISIR